MTINERLFTTMDKKKITQTELANRINTKAQVINNWKTRGTTPPMEYLPKICEVLDISWEYLVTGNESRENYYTHDEKKLIEQYRITNENGKKRIREYTKDMARLHPAAEREPETDAKMNYIEP